MFAVTSRRYVTYVQDGDRTARYSCALLHARAMYSTSRTMTPARAMHDDRVAMGEA